MSKWFVRVLVLLVLSPLAFALGERTFTLIPPTEGINLETGETVPLSQEEIASYDIECDGQFLGNLPNEPLNSDTYEAAPGTFSSGVHACVAFTISTAGIRSEASEPVNFTVPVPIKPGAPGLSVSFVLP